MTTTHPTGAPVEEKVPDEVLNWVNMVREQFKLPTIAELPAGVRNNPSECVIANALKNGWQPQVGSYNVTMSKKRRFRKEKVERIQTTPPITQFISDFDNGNYPQLIK